MMPRPLRTLITLYIRGHFAVNGEKGWGELEDHIAIIYQVLELARACCILLY
jgi:hypothetical protein